MKKKNDIPKINTRHGENEVIGLLMVADSELHKDIGRKVRFKNPTCIVEKELFIILGVQKNYRDELCYRVYAVTGIKDTFGRPALPEDIKFVI